MTDVKIEDRDAVRTIAIDRPSSRNGSVAGASAGCEGVPLGAASGDGARYAPGTSTLGRV